MYVQATAPIGVAAIDICDAKVFYSKQEAWNYREDNISSAWQITPISAKTLFTKKLKTR